MYFYSGVSHLFLLYNYTVHVAQYKLAWLLKERALQVVIPFASLKQYYILQKLMEL